jgi:hypothetical protein
MRWVEWSVCDRAVSDRSVSDRSFSDRSDSGGMKVLYRLRTGMEPDCPYILNLRSVVLEWSRTSVRFKRPQASASFSTSILKPLKIGDEMVLEMLYETPWLFRSEIRLFRL